MQRFTLTERVLSFLFDTMVYVYKNTLIKGLIKSGYHNFPQTKGKYTGIPHSIFFHNAPLNQNYFLKLKY